MSPCITALLTIPSTEAACCFRLIRSSCSCMNNGCQSGCVGNQVGVGREGIMWQGTQVGISVGVPMTVFNLPPLVLKARHLSGSAFCMSI